MTVTIDKGYITLPRSFFQDKTWRTDRAYSEAEAWLDLIRSARYESTEITSRFGSHEVTWGRGEVPVSYRMLQARWKHSGGWVRAFLFRMKRSHYITYEVRGGLNVVRILDYDQYCGRGLSSRNGSGTGPDQACAGERHTPDTPQHTPDTSNKERRKKESLFSEENESVLSGACVCASEGEEPLSDGCIIAPATEVSATAAETSGKGDIDRIAETFNRAVSDRPIPRIISLSERRRKSVNSRLSEHGLDAVLTVIRKAAASDFLNGGGENRWRADFDWIFRPNNFIKILEGNYDNHQPTPAPDANCIADGGAGSQNTKGSAAGNGNRADNERRRRDREFAAHIAAKLTGGPGLS